MATEERDSTADWIVPADRLPPSAFDLQRRIEIATAVARAAEEAAMEIGQASLEAAEQARRAAAHAERSAEASVAAARAAAGREAPASENGKELEGPDRVASVRTVVVAGENGSAAGHELIPGSELPLAWSPVAPAPSNGSAPKPARPPSSFRLARSDPFDERMGAFRRRAERLAERLQRLQAASPVS